MNRIFLLLFCFGTQVINGQEGASLFTGAINFYGEDQTNLAHVRASSDSLFQNTFFEGHSEDGILEFEVPDSLDCFYLLISHVSYYEYQQEICRPFEQNYSIELYERNNELEEVVVEGFRDSRISTTGNVAEIKPGRILRGGQGVYAMNVLKSMPEVLVMPGEEINIRGRKVQNIYLHTSPDAPGISISTERLQNISASRIERVRVLYNEAELHVYLKAVEEAGYASDNELKLSHGRKFYASIAPNLTYNKGKTTVWFDSHIGYVDQKFSSEGSYDVYTDNKTARSLEADGGSDQRTESLQADLMIAHTFDTVYTAGIQLNYGLNEGDIKTSTLATILGEGYSQSATRTKVNANTFAPSVYLKGQFAADMSVTLKSGFITSLQKTRNQGDFDYHMGPQDLEGSQFLGQRNSIQAFVNQVSLDKSLWGSTSLSLKAEHSSLDTEITSLVEQQLIDYSIADSSFVNNLQENRLNLEARVNSMLLKKYIFSLSSSLLFYDYQYEDANYGTLVHQSLNKWVPSVSLSVPLKEGQYLTFFGNTTFRAPNLRNMVYSATSTDGFVLNTNNHGLEPTMSYQVGASLSPVENLTTTLYWMKSDNTYLNYPLFSPEGVFEGNRKINLSDNNVAGLGLYYSNTFFKRFFLSSNASINYNSWDNKGEHAFETRFTALTMNHSLYYLTTTNWYLHLDFTYGSNQRISDQIAMKAWAQLDLGASKRLSKNWSVFLNFSNVLNSYQPSIYSFTGINYRSENDFDLRYISLGINFEFKRKFEEIKREEGILEALDRRIQVQEEPLQ